MVAASARVTAPQRADVEQLGRWRRLPLLLLQLSRLLLRLGGRRGRHDWMGERRWGGMVMLRMLLMLMLALLQLCRAL